MQRHRNKRVPILLHDAPSLTLTPPLLRTTHQTTTTSTTPLHSTSSTGSWGESGYFKLKVGVGKGGLCGIATTASYPVKEHDNPRVPLMCDPFGWSECSAGSTCSCNWPFLFNLFCIRWGGWFKGRGMGALDGG